MKSTKFPAKMHVLSLLRYTILTVLGQLPPRKIAPQHQNQPYSKPNSNRRAIFLGGNCLVDPNPKHLPKNLFILINLGTVKTLMLIDFL